VRNETSLSPRIAQVVLVGLGMVAMHPVRCGMEERTMSDKCKHCEIGDRLVELGRWERHPDGHVRRQFYRPIAAAKAGAE
jgi:hypothetical protein